MDAAAIAALIGGVGGVIGIFLKFIADTRVSQEKRDVLFAKALKDLTDTGKEQVKASNKVAAATEKSALEAKQRNGHLGEQNIQITELITGQNNDIAKVLSTLKSSAITLAHDTEVTAIKVEKVRTDLKEA